MFNTVSIYTSYKTFNIIEKFTELQYHFNKESKNYINDFNLLNFEKYKSTPNNTNSL